MSFVAQLVLTGLFYEKNQSSIPLSSNYQIIQINK